MTIEEIIKQHKEHLTKAQISELIQATERYKQLNAANRANAISSLSNQYRATRRGLQNMGLAGRQGKIVSGQEKAARIRANEAYRGYNRQLNRVENAYAQNAAIRMANETIRRQQAAAQAEYERKLREAQAARQAAEQARRAAEQARLDAQYDRMHPGSVFDRRPQTDDEGRLEQDLPMIRAQMRQQAAQEARMRNPVLRSAQTVYEKHQDTVREDPGKHLNLGLQAAQHQERQRQATRQQAYDDVMYDLQHPGTKFDRAPKLADTYTPTALERFSAEYSVTPEQVSALVIENPQLRESIEKSYQWYDDHQYKWNKAILAESKLSDNDKSGDAVLIRTEADRARKEMSRERSKLLRISYAATDPTHAELYTCSDGPFELQYRAAEELYKKAVDKANKKRNEQVNDGYSYTKWQKEEANKRAGDEIEREATEAFVPFARAKKVRSMVNEDVLYFESFEPEQKYVPQKPTATFTDKGKWNASDYYLNHRTDEDGNEFTTNGSKYAQVVNDWSFVNGDTIQNYTPRGSIDNFFRDVDEFFGQVFTGNTPTAHEYKSFIGSCSSLLFGDGDWSSEADKEKTATMLSLAYYMTDEERARFNTILEKDSGDAADKYFEYLYENVLPARVDQAIAEDTDALLRRETVYDENGNRIGSRGGNALADITMSAWSVPMNLAQGATGAYHQMYTNQNDPVAAQFGAKQYNTAQGLRNAVQENYSGFGKFAYGTVMSMADSATVALIGGGIGKALQGAGLGVKIATKAGSVLGGSLLGGSAFNSAYKEALDRGLSPDKARTVAVGQGFNEMLFESLSLDLLVRHFQKGGILKVSKNGFVNWAVNTLVQGGVEGSEEVFTDIANRLWDNMINGIYSEELTKMREYIGNGMSFDEAKKKVNDEYAEQLGLSFLGGFVSGGVMGGGATFMGMMQNRGNEKLGAGLRQNERVVNKLRNFDFKSEYAQEILQQKNLTNADIADLFNIMQQELLGRYKSDIQKAVADGKITQEQADLLKQYEQNGVQIVKDGKVVDNADGITVDQMPSVLVAIASLDNAARIQFLDNEEMRSLVQAVGGETAAVIEQSGTTLREAEKAYRQTVREINNDTTLSPELKQKRLEAAERTRQNARSEASKIADTALTNKKGIGAKLETDGNGTVKVGKGSGKVTYDFSTKDNPGHQAVDSMTATEQSALRIAKIVAASRPDVNVKVEAEFVGEHANENGYYDPNTKTIHINMSGDNSVLWTLSHELTHHLANTDTEAYTALRTAIETALKDSKLTTTELEDRGFEYDLEKVDPYIAREGNLWDALVAFEREEHGYGKDAEEEVVARCCESFLGFNQFVKDFAHKQYKSAKAVNKFIAQMNIDMQRVSEEARQSAAQRHVWNDESPENQILRQLTEIDRIANLWRIAVNAEAKKRQAAKESEGVRASRMDAERKAEFVSKVRDKNGYAVHMLYRYRGHEYMVTDEHNGYSEPMWVKHKNEQERIDREIADNERRKNEPKEWKYEGSAQEGFDAFWNYVENDDDSGFVKSTKDSVKRFDAEYLDLARRYESGDKSVEAELRKAVDAAARKAGAASLANGRLKEYYHGTSSDFTSFDIDKSRRGTYGHGFYVSAIKDVASHYVGKNGKLLSLYIMTDNLASRDDHRITEEQVADIAYKLDIPGDLFQEQTISQVVANKSDADIIRMLENYLDDETTLKPSEYLKVFREVFGYDGLRMPGENIVWSNDLLKSADLVTYDSDGNIIPLSERFNAKEEDIRYSVKDNVKLSDSEYMNLAEKYKNGTATETETEALRKAVDAAAKNAGYFVPAFHGTTTEFYVFDRKKAGKNGEMLGPGYYFASDRKVANDYAFNNGKVIDAYLQIKKPASTDSVTITKKQWHDYLKYVFDHHTEYISGVWQGNYTDEDIFRLNESDWDYEKNNYGSDKNLFLGFVHSYAAGNAEVTEAAYRMLKDSTGYDGIVGDGMYAGVYVAFTNMQIKSADLVTYDNDGNIIPLSERFKTDRTGEDAWKNEDIRYSLKDSVKPRSAQEQRDKGYKLSKSKFDSLYSAHKIDIGKRWGSIDAQINDILKNGFKGGSGAINVLPVSTYEINTWKGVRNYKELLQMEKEGKLDNGYADRYRKELGDEYGKPVFNNVVQAEFALKKGETVLLVPKSEVQRDKVKQGFKPLPYEIVTAERDYQPLYELYEKSYDEYVSSTNEDNEDIRYSLKDKVRLSTADGTRTYTLGDVTAKLYGNDVELDGGKVRQRVQMMEAIAEVNGTARVDAASEEEAEAFRRAGAEQVVEELEGHGAKYGTWEFKYEERKFTNDSRYDIKQKQKFAKDILKQVGKSSGFTQAQRVKYGAALGRLMDYLWEMQYGKMDGKVVFEFADRLFDSILNDYTALSEADEEFRSELLANMTKTKNAKGSTVYVLEVNDKQMREIKYAYENAMAYASKLSKALGVRVTVKQTENAKTLEDIFTNSTDTRIKSDTNEGDMPGELLRLAQETESRKTNPYAAESEERQALKEGMFDAAMSAAGVEKSTAQQIREAVKETRKAERTKAKTEAKKAIDSARLAERMHEGALRAKDRRISENRERALKQHAADREAKLKQGFRETTQKANETRLKRDMRTIALTWNQRLVKLLANPTEASHIPVQLAKEVAEFTKMLTEYLDKGTMRGQLNLDKILKAYDEAVKADSDIQTMMESEDQFKARGEEAFAEGLFNDVELRQNMEELNKLIKDKDIKSLNYYELRELLDTVRGVAHAVYNANRMIGYGENRGVWEVRDKMAKELRNVDIDQLNIMTRNMLDFRRMMKLISNSDENAVLVELANKLNEGAIEKERIAIALKSMFDPLTKQYGEDIRKWYGKNAEWIDTGIEKNGKKVEITKGMRVSLALHVLNEGNMRHIENGGLTIPNRELYRKGNLADAYMRGETVAMTAEQVDKIISGMTEAEKAYVKVASEFFHKRAGYYINRTALQMLGYRKAKVDNYFPIHTDANYTKSDFVNVMRSAGVEGWGSLKDRLEGASNAIYLEDITSVVNRQIEGVSMYAGLAIPMRNWNAVMNASSLVDGERMMGKRQLGRVIKSADMDVIKGFLADLTESTKTKVTPGERLIGRLAENYVRSVLLGNLKVAMKQVASYPTAAAVIPWKYLGKALLKGGRNHRLISRADVDLINQYTPLYQMRREGQANEIASIMAKRGMEQKLPWLLGWITKMDVMTVGRLWSAAEYMVADQQKNLPVGSDEYYKAVAKVFNDTIQQTQPNFTPLQRGAALRSKNPIVRSLVLFGTQRMQNGNIMLEAAYELKHSKGKSKAEIHVAKQKLGRAVASQIVQNILLIVASLGVDALRGRMKGWQDEDKDITAESLAKGMGDMFLSNFIGSFLGGSETYGLISGLFKKAMDETAYDTEFTVPALDAVETLINFAQNLPDVIKYLTGNHTDDEKLKKAKNFSYDLAKAFGYATGIPLENAIKDLFKGIIPAIKDHVDYFKTGEFPQWWLHQSGKLDNAKTAANYKEWTNLGKKGSVYLAWENRFKEDTSNGLAHRAELLFEDSALTADEKAILLRMANSTKDNPLTSKDGVVYKEDGTVVVDFTNLDRYRASTMLSDKQYEGFMNLVDMGVAEDVASTAFIQYNVQKKQGAKANDRFRDWLFTIVKNPEDRAKVDMAVIGNTVRVEGTIGYKENGEVYADYSSKEMFDLYTSGKKQQKSDAIISTTDTPEAKAKAFADTDNDYHAKGGIVYNDKDKVVADFTSDEAYRASQMGESHYGKYNDAVKHGMSRENAILAVEKHKEFTNDDDKDNATQYATWVFNTYKSANDRAIAGAIYTTKPVTVKGGRTYDENGYIYRDYTSAAWYKLSNRTLSKDGKNKRYEAAKQLEKDGYTAEKTVSAYVELDKLKKKSEWKDWLKAHGYTDDQIKIFLWSRGWAK